MSVHTSIHLHDDDQAAVLVNDFAGAGGLQIETQDGSLSVYFHGLSAPDLAPVRDALEQALRKMRGEAEPSFQIAAE